VLFVAHSLCVNILRLNSNDIIVIALLSIGAMAIIRSKVATSTARDRVPVPATRRHRLLLGGGGGSGRCRGGARGARGRSRRLLLAGPGLGLGLRLGLGGCGPLGGGDGLGFGLDLGGGFGLCLGHLFGFGLGLGLGPLVVVVVVMAWWLVARILSNHAGGGWQLDNQRAIRMVVSIIHTQGLIPAGESRLLDAVKVAGQLESVVPAEKHIYQHSLRALKVCIVGR